ncbi:thiamine phosphate synthase [Lichenibacterium minor]|uniref:Thiamine phosphate synthase n=1 Tax=Lichenibacterium minor TaxID=2316528 RepID=A0A4V1RUD8_9HYPH|nr:thiamine phosphate synthase [Lichenibacterium minor]RYC30804.1 thiamine phosphate synthase [Lichenibacterium minor]
MTEPRTRLFLVTAPASSAEAARPAIEAALGAGDVACVLLRLAASSERDRKEVVRALAPLVQDRGAALLLENPRLVAHTGADGTHAAGADDALAAALDSMKPDRIAGAGGLGSRDDAMRAGEAGADYVMLGDAGFAAEGPAPADVLDEVGWWAEIFNVPCVGFARSLAEVEGLGLTGAEFVALGAAVWDDPRGPAAAVAEARAALDRAEAALAAEEVEA